MSFDGAYRTEVNTLAIDPGKTYVGAALFHGLELRRGEVVKCPKEAMPTAQLRELVRETVKRMGVSTLELLVVEDPIIYPRGGARPNDIMDLARTFGAFMGSIDAKRYAAPNPSAWKGTIDGEICCERTKKLLGPSEMAVLVKSEKEQRGGLSHHVLDAVGLGLFVLQRAGVAMTPRGKKSV